MKYRNPNLLYGFVLALSLGLSACTTAQISKPTKLSDTPAHPASSDNVSVDNSLVPGGDYLHSSLFQAFPSELAVSQDVSKKVSHSREILDFRNLACVSSKITKKDFAPIQSDEIAKRARTVLLADVAIDDSTLEVLTPLHHLEYLHLARTPLKDLHALKGLPSLTALNLEYTKLSEKGWSVVARLHKLERLNVSSSNITGTELLQLSSLSDLKKLVCTDCHSLDPASIQILQRHLPNCKIQSHYPFVDGRDLSVIERKLMFLGELEEADEAIARMLARWKPNAKSDQDYYSIGRGLYLRAKCQAGLQHPDQARQLYLEAMEVYVKHSLPGTEEVRNSFFSFCNRQKSSCQVDEQRSQTTVH